MPVTRTTLGNGVRVLLEPVDSVKSLSIGLWCKTGSKDEFDAEAGITHLIEHMLFKGTPTRTAHQIAETIEGRGGMLNAFTDKEMTCYYCRVLEDDAELAIDVLADMMCHSLLDPEELTREKDVVLEEIRRSEDEPGDHVHEVHLEHRWAGHPLGKPIIGTRESVSSFERPHLASYMERRYRGANVMLAVAGKLDPEVILHAAEQRLGSIPVGGGDETLERPTGAPGEKLVAKPIEQVHFCIGADAPAIREDDLYTARVLDGVLGSGMSSRLFQEIRERRGLAYSVGSYGLHYTAGGAFTIYGGTSLEKWPEVQKVVRDELDKIIAEGPREDELKKVQRAIAGPLLMSLEQMSSRMMRMARNEFNFGREIPIEESIARIEAVTADDVRRLAGQTLRAELMTTTAIGPFAA